MISLVAARGSGTVARRVVHTNLAKAAASSGHCHENRRAVLGDAVSRTPELQTAGRPDKCIFFNQD